MEVTTMSSSKQAGLTKTRPGKLSYLLLPRVCIHKLFLTVFQTTNFRLFKPKEFANDNFKFVKNGRRLFKRVENTVGKGENACYEQFLLFPQCFQKTYTADK